MSDRRDFLKLSAVTCFAFSLPLSVRSAVSRLNSPIKIGMITDLHQDIMHDGLERLKVFVDDVKKLKPNAIMQLGDFAYPGDKNKEVIDLFNGAHQRRLHVIGNHDTDSGYTNDQCLDYWKMPARYYVENIDGISFVVLDGNEKGSPSHKGGYASFIGEDQMVWLEQQLNTLEGAIVIVSHQPLAGPFSVDNAEDVQDLLLEFQDKILFAINGHTHIDLVLKAKKITYVHLNSASYLWVGKDYKHESYDSKIHKENPWISSTCPYKESLYAFVTIDPYTLSVKIEGRNSKWVGTPPNELGVKGYPTLIMGEVVAPRISDRSILRLKK